MPATLHRSRYLVTASGLMEWQNRLHRSFVLRAAKCASNAKRSRGRDKQTMVVTVSPRVAMVRRRRDAASKQRLLAHGLRSQRDGFVLRIAPAERTHNQVMVVCISGRYPQLPRARVE